MNRQHNNTNKLIHEKSPYLLQHAHNPVQWYPWGEEAFKKAREEGKLIFLSIGYSTCHWCHVMERESFEDEEAARALNRSFVAVKVDREERPDIDAVYMAVCQAMTGQGGWPLTVIMTPEQKPVFAGTYIPRVKRYGYPGLIELLEAYAAEWRNDRERLETEALRITNEIFQRSRQVERGEPDVSLLQNAAKSYGKLYDKSYGGFGEAPKFPCPHNLLFLMRFGEQGGDSKALQMAFHTLNAMYRGGIFDHIGGGFSRYSTDRLWLVPHFEKMLYDNALMAYVYLEAYRISKKELFGRTARSILSYVAEALTDEEGGFYCGQDADSEGEEGKYYVFTPEEIADVLGKSSAEQFCRWYGATREGNFEGKNVLNLIENPDYGCPFAGLDAMTSQMKSYREARAGLHRDDKILSSWNGMMIAAFAKAYQVLGDREYLETAGRAQRFISAHMSDRDGRLNVRYRDGESKGTGQLDDYAFMAWAWLELYQAAFDVEYLKKAVTAARWMIELFWDEKEGGLYLYASDAEQLISRPKEVYDGAVPSGNSMAAWVLVKLGRITADPLFSDYAGRQLRFLAGHAKDYPTGHSAALTAMMEELYGSRELVCVSDTANGKEDLFRSLKERGFWNLAVVLKTRDNEEELAELCPYTRDYPVETGKTAYYVCENGTCRPKTYHFGTPLS